MTKQGDSDLRYWLDIGTRNVVRYPRARSWAGGGGIEALLERRRPMVVAVANKLATDRLSDDDDWGILWA
ncbi:MULTISPECIES: hypothetical protein [unclassified Bradyrhizobium]|uniref:hypothetical protein n=1 Tax=unclassified Bradyrhizobium TaxID=2631580 RepID=UPI001FCBB983|nr:MULTISPECIES: hypothetical protein [Bradyrhizobium]UWU95915.1 hypothetical protein N2604_06960 [Bradyrhizobium sp. CB1015]